ncbi:MAG: DUF6455 family protein [Rhodospirillales bacterium]|nr:DUF6455 family protein [Rhodospirillales bacterium]
MSLLGSFESTLRRILSERLQRSQHYQELMRLDDRQLDDIGIERSALMLVVAGAAEAPERVGMMAGRLGIEAAALESRKPLLNEMIKRCAACRTKVLCAWWLAESADDEAFREFCPNAGRFVELRRRGL